MPTQPRLACAYVRVSKEKEDGLSPEQQKEKAELQAKLLNLDLVRVYQDIDISGRSDQRPAFQEMIRDIKRKKYQVCLVYKLDRFCRNVRDFQHYVDILESHGCSLVSISQNIDTSTPVGRLIRNILADFAQFESEMIAERTRDNKISAARKGRWNGGHIPVGFAVVDKHLAVNPDEAPIIVLIFKLRGKGWGFHRIANELTARGYKPRQGYGSSRKSGHWTQGAVRSITYNPIYKGDLVYADVTLQGALPAIVDAETWEQAQVLSVLPGRAQQSPNVLMGLLHCTHCDSDSWSIVLDGRNYIRKVDGVKKTRVPRYVCRIKKEEGARTCPTRRIDQQSLESAILNLVISFADENVLSEEIKSISVPGIDVQADAGRIREELDRVRSLMSELFSDYYDHRLITRDQFAAKNGEYLERERLLAGKLKELQQGDPETLAEKIGELSAGAKTLRDGWDRLTQAERRIGLRKVVRQIDVYPDRIEVDLFAVRKMLLPTEIRGAAMYF